MISATAVIVLYKQKYNDSDTLKGIRDFLLSGANQMRLDIVIYDNSPEPQAIPTDFLGEAHTLIYFHDETNPGLVKAYNFALRHAIEHGHTWFMTFDQDTHVDVAYFCAMQDALSSDIFETDDIVSVVPTVVCNHLVVSPIAFGTDISQFEPYDDSRIRSGIISGFNCINSASAFRVKFLESIRGYNTNFMLHLVDAWIFDCIKYENKKIFLLDSKIEQDYSTLISTTPNYKKLSASLRADIIYNKTCKGTAFNLRTSLAGIFNALIRIVIFRHVKINWLRLRFSIKHLFTGKKQRYNKKFP